jgi:Family of unknown function (DUF5681)
MSEDEADNPRNDGQPTTQRGAAPYEVGNKKPPKEFRFKPGQSGNPKGRPKGSTSVDAKIKKELDKLVTVHKNGKSLRMTKLEIGVMRLVDRFMAGDPKSTAAILSLDKRNDTPKSAEETADVVALPDEANVEFIVERLKGLKGR